jgi:hypothetical protein
MVLLLLRKLIRFRNFLRTWLPRRQSLVGADIQTRRVSQNPNTREPKMKFLVKDTRNLAFAEPPSRLPWSSSSFTSPSSGDRPPSLVFLVFSCPLLAATDQPSLVFLFSHVPFLRRQTSLGGVQRLPRT